MPHHSDYFSTKPELSGLRNRKIISGVFEGKSPPTEYESAWSPTSPLDFRLFSSFGNPFGSSSARLIRKRKQKSWDSEKVGLMSIVDSLDDSSRPVLPSSECNSLVVMRHGNPKCRKPHLPNLVVDDLPLSFLPLAKSPMHLLGGSFSVNAAGNIALDNNGGQVSQGSLDGRAKSEMETSEDYTCVIKHGPIPKTTHFFGDQVMESTENNGLKMPENNKKESIFVIEPINLIASPTDVLPSNFLSSCWLCKKKLFLGEEIYMYRGYKAFCSIECRGEVITRDEIMETESEAKEEGYEAESEPDSPSDKDLPKKKSNRAFVTMA